MSKEESVSAEFAADAPQPRNVELYGAVVEFVECARAAYCALPKSGYFPTLSTMPEAHSFDSGFPYITQNQFSKVRDFGRVFGPTEGQLTRVAYGEWESFARLMAVVCADDNLRRMLRVRDEPLDERARRWAEVSVGLMALGIFDRLMHVHGAEFTERHLRPVYCEVERTLLDDELPVCFVAPVALTGFVVEDTAHVSGEVYVAKIPEPLNLARMPNYSSGLSVNQLVLSAATHAVVLTGWTIPNEGPLLLGGGDFDWYPSAHVDRFFDALRAVTGYETGYGQIFMLPLGWATDWHADLPSVLTGGFARRYPSGFERRRAWNEERPTVTAQQFSAVCELHKALAANDGGLSIAGRRLSTAMLRDDEADAILDLLIGLEALLGDQTTTEVTHKLAIRASVVLARLSEPRSDPLEVFAAVRKIYKYRSAVAHGDLKRAEKLKTISTENGTIKTVALAREYLRRILVSLSRHPEMRNGSAIDQTLVLPSFRASPEVHQQQRVADRPRPSHASNPRGAQRGRRTLAGPRSSVHLL